MLCLKELVERFHQMEQQQIETYDLLKEKSQFQIQMNTCIHDMCTVEQEKARKAELSKQLNELRTSSTEEV